TIAILLKAIESRCDGSLPKLAKNINRHLMFEDARGNEFFRIEHCRHDKTHFNDIIRGTVSTANGTDTHRMYQAFEFFRTKVDSVCKTDEDRASLFEIILKKIPVISMLLAVHDDEQVIFDTINSLGVKLNSAELLKNFIFKDATLHRYFNTHWASAFEHDDDQIEFWNTEKTAGRIFRTNIEVLLYCYLIARTLKEVKIERLFKEYKSWLSGKSSNDNLILLEDLKQNAAIYYSLPTSQEFQELSHKETEKRFFHVVENLSITTIYPLILHIYREVIDNNERNAMLSVLESYIVRRVVCKLTTKNYNNLFISIIRKLVDAKQSSQSTINAGVLKNILLQFSEETNQFPTDQVFIEGIKSSQLSNAHAREFLYFIALFEKDSKFTDTSKLSCSSYSVEHMMPQKWEENWAVATFDDNQKLNRSRKLRTLGNLTLITKNLNSKLKNDSWLKKKETLKIFSSLGITKDYVDLDVWDENAIDRRSNDLVKSALLIWQR
ncbi:MAG: DUF1524 domain-containing protein, partial [Proteobacteria bacterium]